MIVCKCPGCDQKLRVVDQAAVKKILCPRCKTAVPVPRPVAATGPETVALPASRSDLPAPVADVARTETLGAAAPRPAAAPDATIAAPPSSESPDATLAAPSSSPETGLTLPAGEPGSDPR